MHPTVGQQNFGLADAAGIKDHLARRRVAGVVLIADAKVQIAERHPDPLAAPAHMDKFAVERHCLAEGRTSFGRQLFFETGLEREVPGVDDQSAHSKYPQWRFREIPCPSIAEFQGLLLPPQREIGGIPTSVRDLGQDYSQHPRSLKAPHANHAAPRWQQTRLADPAVFCRFYRSIN